MCALIATHLGRGLQTGTASRAFWLAKYHALELCIELYAWDTGRLSQRHAWYWRSDRWSDAACTAAWATSD